LRLKKLKKQLDNFEHKNEPKE